MSMVKMYGEGLAKEWGKKHSYRGEQTAVKTFRDMFFGREYVEEVIRPKSFSTGERKYVIDCGMTYATIKTYTLKGKLLCEEELSVVELFHHKAKRKYVLCRIVRGNEKHGLISATKTKTFATAKSIDLDGERIPAYLIKEKQYFLPFGKTEVSKIVAPNCNFAGFEYRIGRYHYYNVPYANEVVLAR